MLHSPKQHVILNVFTENKLFYFSKRALHVGTACNKWLKEALLKHCIGNIINSKFTEIPPKIHFITTKILFYY